MKALSILFAGALYGIACLTIGLYVGEARSDARHDKPIVLTKTCPAHEQFKPKWDCGATEAKTYCATCLRRKWL